MALKLKKRDGYPTQICGFIRGGTKYCDEMLNKYIDDYIKKHNELYKKRREYLKYGIKSYEVVQYHYASDGERTNAYILSYVVNFYK